LGQNTFEEILYAEFIRLSGSVNFQHHIIRSHVEGDSAVLQIRKPSGGQESSVFDYVLACDGANSVVRRNLDIGMEGPPSLARFASAYFQANLDGCLGDDIGPVNFISGREVRGAIIGFDMKSTWAFMCVIPPDITPTDFSPEVMLELVRRAIGDRTVKVELTSVGTWNMSAQVALRFRKGPFFLVGDSAHRFPPTGGLGLNTGIQDAHNLAWKLALVARGECEQSLLDSYERERHSIAQSNRDHSLNNALRMAEVDHVIGAQTLSPVDPSVVSHPPPPPISHPIDGMSPQALAARARIQLSIDDQREHFDCLQVEIGYSYTGLKREMDASTGPNFDDQTYRPRVQVGSLLPHVWIHSHDGMLSSLDLYDKRYLTLLAGIDAARWERALTARSALPVIVCTVANLRIATPYDLEGTLEQASKGAVLVRPDGHVVWICDGEFTEAKQSKLQQSIRELVREPLR
jgi:hypothetical protein